jgi:hypothetical protein
VSRKARAPVSAERKRGSGSSERQARPAVRAEPFTSLRFAVGIENLGRFGAVEVVLPESRFVTSGRRGSVVHSALTLRRGLTTDSQWYDWWADSRRRRAASPRRVTLELLDAQGSARMRWFFPDSVPQAYSVSPLSALRESVVLESLELAVGDFVLQKLQ